MRTGMCGLVGAGASAYGIRGDTRAEGAERGKRGGRDTGAPGALRSEGADERTRKVARRGMKGRQRPRRLVDAGDESPS
jgi:hypothetical protein